MREPEFSQNFLDDFHAGVYPDNPELLARIYANPEAVELLDKLERVTDLLRAIGVSYWA